MYIFLTFLSAKTILKIADYANYFWFRILFNPHNNIIKWDYYLDFMYEEIKA